MKVVEYWRWRYRDPATGRICRTMFQMTAQEAADLYPDPQRIEGSMTLREIDEDAVDTTPDVFRPLSDEEDDGLPIGRSQPQPSRDPKNRSVKQR